jgi:uncharacterized pyridoxamine 5'-phosphate oxidase family protein
MAALSEGLIRFFHRQNYTIITTIDEKGFPHNSCKGIVDIKPEGRIYLLDLYKEKTYSNLQNNVNISVTAVDEHKFIGYSLKGKAHIVERGKIENRIVKLWEDKITKRLSNRLLKNIKGEKGHSSHPEALLPKPEYLIEIDVDEIIDLTPHHIK